MSTRLLFSLLLSCLTIAPVFAADKGIDARVKGAAATAPAASAPRRLALVVGNGAYRFAGSLANPARDAELIAKTLKGVGFELYGGSAQVDLSRVALDQAIEGFGEQIRAGDVALFYYSGHGVQVNGENYLIPVDADLKNEAEVRVKTVPINLLFAKLEGVPGAVNLVILDACRNNPFARSFRSSGGGLASVSAPTGTLVAFSTSPGQVAEDGSGSNSTYTAALARTIVEPGLQVEEVFKQVRSTVTGTTNGRQTPWENTSLTGNFRFIEGDAVALRKAALSAAGDVKQGELAALLRMEEEAARQKEREQVELTRKAAELAQLDAQIAAMKTRLGAGTATGNDSLKTMVAMVQQKEAQARQLEALRKQREAEELKRQQEIERLKGQAKEKRRAAVEADIADYQTIANSPYGADMVDAAWGSLVGKYPAAAEVGKGDVALLRTVVVEGVTLAELRARQREQERLRSYVGELVDVPGGCYRMGSNNDGNDEKLVHEVCVDGFQIGKYEVTQGQWQKVMGNNPAYFSGCDDGPVEMVDWNDAQEFLRKLNQLTGKSFRLPTEAEWEYAARSGGKQETYSGGETIDAVAWYTGNSGGKTHPVGQKQANGLGIFDMSGNVWEWCQDWYDSGYYAKSPKNNPQGPSGGSGRVNRGGSWILGPEFALASARGGYSPNLRDRALGLRLVLPAGH